MSNELSSLAIVSVLTRHTSDCPHKNDRYYKGKGYRCRKSLYINENGKDRRISAKTRSIDHYNENPKPFIWTAKAADILEKVKRARAV